MKKKNLIMLLAGFLLASCGGEDKTAKPKDMPHLETAAARSSGKDPRSIGGEKSQFQLEIDRANSEIRRSGNPILGYWVGDFGKNMINITLSEIDGNTIKGHSVCAGNYRPVTGTIEASEGNPAKITLNEPGDDPYDGKFEFEISADRTQLKGKWTPFKAKGNKAKTYMLEKRDFAYNPNVGEYRQTSQQRLKEADVENLTEEKLKLMRNEIYARHGYSFKEKDMRRHFEQKDWYMPVGVDIRDQLSDIEVDNIDLIYMYEEYYGMSYDDYGR